MSTSYSLSTSSTAISNGSGRDLAELEKRLGYRFSARQLLERALTHKSFSADHNERLEFLGDAVLGYVIAQILHETRTDVAEDALTMIRAELVRRETLAEIAIELELGDFLRLGTGERRSGGRQRTSIIANALEAVFGALEQDGGVDVAREVIANLYVSRLEGVGQGSLEDVKDPKTQLQEILQGVAMPLPVYEILSLDDSEPNPVILVTCRVDPLGLETRGAGRSRRVAEKAAAAQMIELVIERV